MYKVVLTDGQEVDYVEVASSNVTETTVGEATTAVMKDDLGNTKYEDEGVKYFCRDTLKWYSSNGDGTALYLFEMG